mgnify:CR=1 FL=1
MAKVIDGKAFAEGLRGRIAKAVASLKEKHGLTPGLAVVLVGEDPASKVYVANKAKQTVEVGMHSEKYELPADAPEAEVLALIEKLNADPAIHGILVQLPVPEHIDPNKIIATISPVFTSLAETTTPYAPLPIVSRISYLSSRRNVEPITLVAFL